MSSARRLISCRTPKTVFLDISGLRAFSEIAEGTWKEHICRAMSRVNSSGRFVEKKKQ